MSLRYCKLDLFLKILKQNQVFLNNLGETERDKHSQKRAWPTPKAPVYIPASMYESAHLREDMSVTCTCEHHVYGPVTCMYYLIIF